jgi:hypothetical protein
MNTITVLIAVLCIFVVSANVVVFAAFGTKTITVTYRNITIYVNGQKKTPEEEPFIYNGRTYVPLRFIAEALNKEVKWDGVNNRIDINDTNSAATVIFGFPCYLVSGMHFVEGFESFEGVIKKAGLWYGSVGGYPLVTAAGKYYADIKICNSIILLPPNSEEIQEYRDLQKKYPDLCPLSADKLESELKSYSNLLYFSQDKTSKIRGVIVADLVDSSLAELLLSKGVILDTFLRWENGNLVILK